MRHTKYTNQAARFQNRKAALFVDFESLYKVLGTRLENRAHPDELINEVLDELRRYLLEEMRTPTIFTRAYADFSTLVGSNSAFIQRNLALLDAEPCFVPAALQENAVEIRLTAEVVEAVHLRPDLTTYVIVTGDRMYLPLVQILQRYGRTALVVMVDPQGSVDHIPCMGDELFIDVLNLISGTVRQELLGEDAQQPARNGVARREPVPYLDITNPAGRLTLDIIEEHFGQYEEVYLTPLLRKLSELLDDALYDPKSIINELEDAGAVWLEKRRGFPYDYTVLIVDGEHPDVQQIQREYYERTGDSPDDFEGDEFYYEEEFDEEADTPAYGDEEEDFSRTGSSRYNADVDVDVKEDVDPD